MLALLLFWQVDKLLPLLEFKQQKSTEENV